MFYVPVELYSDPRKTDRETSYISMCAQACVCICVCMTKTAAAVCFMIASCVRIRVRVRIRQINPGRGAAGCAGTHAAREMIERRPGENFRKTSRVVH